MSFKSEPSSVFHTHELGRIEALNERGIGRPGIAERGELGQQQRCEIDALPAVPFGFLDLRVDPHRAAHRLVQPLDETQLVGKCRNAEQAGVLWKPRGILGDCAARSAALEHVQQLELGEIEVDHVVAPVSAMSPGKSPCDVGDVI